jgi:hypothetical protein
MLSKFGSGHAFSLLVRGRGPFLDFHTFTAVPGDIRAKPLRWEAASTGKT